MTKPSLRYPAMLWLTLGLGIGLSLGATWFVGQGEAARRQTQF